MPLKKALIIIFLVLNTIASATDYYISSSGNDANNGLSSSTPWKTIAKVNSAFSTFLPGDRILFKRGDTFSGTITITRSGSPGNPIIISAYGTGAYPVISGFTALSGWINISGNIWQASVSTGKTDLNMFIINGVQYGMGRYPNSTYLSYESHINNTTIIDNQLTGNPNWTGAEAVIRKIRWMLDRNVITNHTGTYLTYTTGSSWTPTDTYGYFIQNDPKTLDVFGEWYYNPSNKTLKMYSSIDPSLYNIKASVIDTLVYINDKDYVTFENLTFEGANHYAVLNYSGQHINIQNCIINFSGIDGILTNDNSINANMLLDGLTINHANECAIQLKNLTTYAWIKNNTIKNIGIIPGAGTNNNNSGDGIVIYGKNTLAEFNSIDSVGHSGIQFSNCDSVQVRNNYVSNFCLVRYDGGGIYSWNNSTTTTHGQKIKDNIILNGNRASNGIGSESSLFVHGIYLDTYSTNIDLTGNTTANCSTSGIYILLSSDIKVTNNTSYNNGSQIKFTYKYGSQLQIMLIITYLLLKKQTNLL